MKAIRKCKYCNKNFKYTTHGAKSDSRRGFFCDKCCYDSYQRELQKSNVPNVKYLEQVVSSVKGTITLTKLSELTGITKGKIRKSINGDYVEWHIKVKGVYEANQSNKRSEKHKNTTTKVKYCEYCNELFEGHFNRKFCSMKCKDAYDYRKIVNIGNCYICGNTTYITRGVQNSITICSDKCRAQLLNKGIKAQQLFDMLESFGIKGVREYTEEGLRNDTTGAMLRVDFYSADYNLAVEYHGEQHYVGKPFFDKTDTLEERKHRDYIKEKYLKSKGIDLIIWKYNTPVTLEKVKQVFAKYALLDNAEVS